MIQKILFVLLLPVAALLLTLPIIYSYLAGVVKVYVHIKRREKE